MIRPSQDVQLSGRERKVSSSDVGPLLAQCEQVSPREVEEVQLRASVSEAVAGGRIDEACAAAEALAPGVLAAHPHVRFRLHAQKFMELVHALPPGPGLLHPRPPSQYILVLRAPWGVGASPLGVVARHAGFLLGDPGTDVCTGACPTHSGSSCLLHMVQPPAGDLCTTLLLLLSCACTLKLVARPVPAPGAGAGR